MAWEHLICIIICFILQKDGLFYKNREDCGGCLTCEELVGFTYRRWYHWLFL